MSTGQAGAGIGIGIGIGTTLNCNHEAPIVAHSLRGEGFDASEDGTGRETPLVPVPMAIQAGRVRENPDSGPGGVAYTLEARAEVQAVAFAQNTRDEVRLFGGDGNTVGALAAEAGMKQQCYVAFTCRDPGADAGYIAPILRGMGHDGSHANGGGQVAVAVAIPETAMTLTSGGKGERGRMDPVNTDLLAFTQNQAGDVLTGDVMHSLGTNSDATGRNAANVQHSMAVRRLTPKECERLMGVPDDYTLVPFRGRMGSDGPRYKMLGNSIATPCLAWIGRRIEAVNNLPDQ